MPSIERHSINTTTFDEWFVRVELGSRLLIVTLDAERLQRGGPERVGVASVRLDVIGDGCGHDQPARLTRSAQWLALKLELAQATPFAMTVRVSQVALDALYGRSLVHGHASPGLTGAFPSV